MQDIHSIGGGSRFFSGGGGGDRRLRPQNHQALKCPRCDSLNTKFCYYNNYNLSQPRHFCKACRRYWTKGGVLRNVPVGGGCRKTKRSKSKQTTSSADIAAAATTTTTAATTTTPNIRSPSEQQSPPQEQQRKRNSPNSHSSSENSSLTATNTAAPSTAALEVVSAHSSSSASINLLNSINDSKLIGNNSMNSNFQGGSVDQGSDCGIFSEIGSFSSLINSTNDHLGFGFSNMMNHPGLEPVQQDQNQRWQQKMVKEELKLHESMTGGFIDQTVDVELSALQSSRSGNGGGFGTLDWQGTSDQGLFDQTYWNQSQWTDQDQPSLYLP